MSVDELLKTIDTLGKPNLDYLHDRFVLITQLTGQTKILLLITTAFGNGPKMVNLEPAHGVILMALTIFAAVACTIPNSLFDHLRKTAHDARFKGN